MNKKYKANSKYIFETEILCSGTNAKEVEEKLKSILIELIKSNKTEFVSLSNETKTKDESSIKIFNILESLQCIVGKTITYIGRIPDSWVEILKKEMEEKEEIDKKRLFHLDDCIMIVLEDKEKKYALIVDRRGLYTISSSPPK